MKKSNALVILSLFNLLFYFSMGSFWSGIQGMFGVSWLAYLILGLLITIAIVAVSLRLLKINNVLVLILLILSGVFSAGLFYMLNEGIGSLPFVLRTFCYGLTVLAFIFIIYYLIFIYPKQKLSKMKAAKITLFLLIFLFILIYVFDLRINYFTSSPVVYAVEDEYQIVWGSNADSASSVRVGDQVYYDLFAGSQKSETRVHKVVVPMSALDNEKSYTISSTTIIYRGPYSGIKGRTISKSFAFEPVDLSDGLNYYCLSDAHDYGKAASITGTYFGNDLDFLVLLGDIASHLEIPEDNFKVNQIAYNITKGEKPVVFARGNHEVKADSADEFYKYVGSKNEKFFYTFILSGVFGVVLDFGEDHADNWWEFYDLAQFDLYRQEQTEFINNIISEARYEEADIKYRMLISHIPVTYVLGNFLKEIKAEWTNLLNTINFDLALSGHHHQLLPITREIPANSEFLFHENYTEDSGKTVKYRTDSNFDTFIVSRRSNEQAVAIKENLYGKELSGLAVSVNYTTEVQTIYYTNTLKEVVEIVDPYTGVTKQEYLIDLK